MIEEYEYVKVTGSIFDLKDDFEAGNLYWHYHDEGRFIKCLLEADLFIGMGNNCLYKRIKKERKFNEGEWYPCVDKDGDVCICNYHEGFFCTPHSNLGYLQTSPQSMKWIGESLGKIKFGE